MPGKHTIRRQRVQQHLRSSRITSVTINDGKMSVIPSLRSTVLHGHLNSQKPGWVPCVGYQSEKLATVHKGQENSLQVLSFSSEDNVETGQGWLHVSHTAIRLRLWRNIFPHFTSILPFFISFKMHTHSITNSHTVGMFKVSLNTMRQKKAKKSCNLIQSKQIGFKITVKFCEISISHIQAATCCLGSH